MAEQNALFTHTLSSVQGPQLVTQEVNVTDSQIVRMNC